MRKGFSLLELMIVIVILGLLASLVLPNLIGKGEEAKRKLVCVQMKSLSEALKMFKMDNGKYPETQEGLEALVKNPDTQKYPNYPSAPYLSDGHVPKDPWGSPYIYINKDGTFDLMSLGADRKEGGTGENADIRFSECQRK